MRYPILFALALVLPVVLATYAQADIRQEHLLPPPPKAIQLMMM